MTESRNRIWPAVVLALAPLVALGRTVFFGLTIGPFDQIKHFAPWNGPTPDRPWDILQADGVLQFYTWRDLVFSAWARGQLPFWNPYSLGGTPLLANSQSAALYPPHILFGLLHVPTGVAIVFLAWIHLAWAGIGTFKLARRLGSSRTGGVIAGLSFALSAFMLAWTSLPSVISTVSWIPWVLFGVASLFIRDELPKWPFRATAWLAASIGMLALAGHLQFAAYGAIGAIVFAVGLSIPRRTNALRAWVCASLATVVGFMLAAPQVLPSLAYSQFSHRRAGPTEDGYGKYVGSALKPYELGTIPFAPPAGQPFEFAPADIAGTEDLAKRPSTYFPQFLDPSSNYAEEAVSVGVLVLALVFLAPWRQRLTTLAPLAAIALVALLFALGTPINRVLYFAVPGWSATGSPGRMIVLFVLAACLIAGIAIDHLPALPEKGVKRLIPLLLPFVLLGVGGGLMGGFPADKSSTAIVQLASADMRAAIPGLILSGVIVAVTLAVAYHRDRLVNRLILIASPIVLAMVMGAIQLIPSGDPSFLSNPPVRPTDPNSRVAVVNNAWGMSLSAPALFPPNTPAAGRIHDLSGYDSLIHRDTVELLRDIDGDDPAPPVNGNMMFIKPTADAAKLAAAGVSEVWSRRELPQLGAPEDGTNGVFRYRISGPGRASTPMGPATIDSETSSSIHLSANGPGRLVLRDRNMPGWLAKVDGKHIAVQGTTWREVDLAPGHHSVEFDYVPPDFVKGVLLAAVGLVALLVLIFVSRFLRKPTLSNTERG